MATIILRAAKGSPLTNNEVDANFSNINTEVLSIINTLLPLKADLASPTFTGTPSAPTAAENSNTTQIATTAFVIGQASATVPLVNGTAAIGASVKYARADHVHPTDTTRAPLASPALTGTPTAPTAAVDTNTTQLATTAFVLGQAANTNPLVNGTVAIGTSSRFARADHVHPTDTTRAPLASPALTGVPTAPTAALNTNTTQLSTTAFVMNQITFAEQTLVPRTSTTGSAVIPSGTSAQRDGSPVEGMIRYNTDLVQYESYLNGNWAPLGSGQTLGNALTKAIFYNANTISENITIQTGTNGGTFGPVTISDGFTVTVSEGSTWSIV
jgi:hypothetical protein